MIPGGYSNSVAGSYGFAAGRRARAAHQGAFVWADSTDADLVSSAADTFSVRASGGVAFTTSGGGFSVDGNSVLVAGATTTSGSPTATEINSVDASGSDVAGGNLTLSGGIGTGFGDGGSIIFKTADSSLSNGGAIPNSSAEAMRIDEQGRVGIGQSSPSSILDVNGTIEASSLLVGDTVTASGTSTFIGGGMNHDLTSSANYSGVAAGLDNDIANADYAFVGGGNNNDILTGANNATIAGGAGNTVSAANATIGGGSGNSVADTGSIVAGGLGNSINGLLGNFIGGGANNHVINNSQYGVVAGGSQNTITNGSYSFIGGGDENSIKDATHSFIGSGANNTNGANYGFVGGGLKNTNTATYGAVLGGASNTVSGTHATVPGGYLNEATADFSFAVGHGAKAKHQGSFVWADSTATTAESTGVDQYWVVASGGAVFDTSGGAGDFVVNTGGGDMIVNGQTVHGAASDRNLKKNFEQIDAQGILEKLAGMEISRWNYVKDDDSATKHIGPMLQDFKPTFYPGRELGRTITWQEFHGVELAAIKGLNEKLEEALRTRDQEIAELRTMIEKLQASFQAGGQ